MYRRKKWKRSSDLRSSSNWMLDNVCLKQPFKSFIKVVAAFLYSVNWLFQRRWQSSLLIPKREIITLCKNVSTRYLERNEPPSSSARLTLKAAIIVVVWELLGGFFLVGGSRRVSRSEIKVMSYSLKHTPYHAALGVAKATSPSPTASQNRGSVQLTA